MQRDDLVPLLRRERKNSLTGQDNSITPFTLGEENF